MDTKNTTFDSFKKQLVKLWENQEKLIDTIATILIYKQAYRREDVNESA